jgi:hypothetical protein
MKLPQLGSCWPALALVSQLACSFTSASPVSPPGVDSGASSVAGDSGSDDDALTSTPADESAPSTLGLDPLLRDLWAHADLGSFTGSFQTALNTHATALLRVRQ